jgi:hypothetical protein
LVQQMMQPVLQQVLALVQFLGLRLALGYSA